MISLASVVLPPPFGPVMTRNFPSSTSRETFLTMSARPCASAAVRLRFLSVSIVAPLCFSDNLWVFYHSLFICAMNSPFFQKTFSVFPRKFRAAFCTNSIISAIIATKGALCALTCHWHETFALQKSLCCCYSDNTNRRCRFFARLRRAYSAQRCNCAIIQAECLSVKERGSVV